MTKQRTFRQDLVFALVFLGFTFAAVKPIVGISPFPPPTGFIDWLIVAIGFAIIAGALVCMWHASYSPLRTALVGLIGLELLSVLVFRVVFSGSWPNFLTVLLNGFCAVVVAYLCDCKPKQLSEEDKSPGD